METGVPNDIESLPDESTTFQDVVQSDTRIRLIFQPMWTLHSFNICTLDAETIQQINHTLEAYFNPDMESISAYLESILLNSASSRAPLYRVWDFHQGDISAARRALYSELAAHPGNHSQLHQVPSTHPGNHSQLHQVPSTHSGSHAMLHSQLHPVPLTHPGNYSQLHLVPSTHSGSHVILDLFQDPTGVEEQPLVNRPRLPETFLGITSQAALAMLTISVSGRTSFSQNANILFWSAAACNLIGFLFCLFSILLSGRRTGVAPRIVTGTGFVFTAYGFLAIMGMLLSDNIMLWITGLACIASFPALVSAFMK